MKYGKRPARPRTTDFKLAKYLAPDKLPAVPDSFGYDSFIPTTAWGTLGNDAYGDCVWAGAAHEHMLLTGGNHRTPAAFDSLAVLGDYSAATGFDPHDPSTDNGTDMHDAMRYRQRVGVRDAHGQRHKVGAYLALEPGDVAQLFQALYLFETIGVGIAVPESAENQFYLGQRWTVVPGSPLLGGHYVCATGRSSVATIRFVTWGTRTAMSTHFYEVYSDEAYAYVSPDTLNGARSLRGLDIDQLNADLAAL